MFWGSGGTDGWAGMEDHDTPYFFWHGWSWAPLDYGGT